jgi:hypothetical protein
MAQTALSLIIEPQAPWHADWAWGIPLIVLTVIFHVLGLGIIEQRIVPLYGTLLRHRQTTGGFAVVMGTTTLLATCLHAIEAAIWGGAYILIGALPDAKLAMLYSLGAMTTYGHENLYTAAHWQLLGSIEALNGWLLFGLTTAFLFALIEKTSPANRAKH